jgi:serine/threonine protein kinase
VIALFQESLSLCGKEAAFLPENTGVLNGGEFRVHVGAASRGGGLHALLRIAIGLAAAVGQAHRHGLIHKDIKPAHALVNDAGHVWLTGFGIASRLPRERQSPEAPEFIAGSLPYMAPEQTGRMNRSLDSRGDLYSLGVTLYEMSTGGLPFTASDPMEWVHCQIARQPVSPCERAPDIPGPVAAIVMKLLAKTAEDRTRQQSVCSVIFSDVCANGNGMGASSRSSLANTTSPTGCSFPKNCTDAHARSIRCWRRSTVS